MCRSIEDETLIDPSRLKFVDEIMKSMTRDSMKHEEIIRELLLKPFKVPLPGYCGGS